MKKNVKENQQYQIEVVKIYLIKKKKRQEGLAKEDSQNKVKDKKMRWKVEKENLKKKY